MNKVSFLHTHYLPQKLLDGKYIETSVIAIEMYPDLLMKYYGDYEVFGSLEECISWHGHKYEGNSVKYAIENIAVLKDLHSLKKAKELGLEVVQLFHSRTNSFYDKGKGLTEEGHRLLHELLENDLILDLSHLDDNGIKHIMGSYDGRVIVSHCVCKDIIETIHPRTNAISEETIKYLSDRGCLFGIPFVNDLVSRISHDTYENDIGIINDIVSQILFFANCAGIENVSLGPDFMDMNHFSKVFGQDIKIPDSLYEMAGYKKIISELKKRSLSESDISLIMSGNVKKALAK